MIAREIMSTDLKTVTPETTVREAAQLMADSQISGVPVVDAQGALVGIVSESDLIQTRRIPSWYYYWVDLEGFIAAGTDLAQAKARDRVQELSRHLESPVSDVMTKKVMVASPEAPLEEIVRLMVSNRINRIPIVEQGRLLGIVTRGDILRSMKEEDETAKS